MSKLLKYFDLLFPYLSVLFLWRLDSHIWNPCGVLALIPIFYFSFVQPRSYFYIFAMLGCFLLDASFDSQFFWLLSYLILFSVNSFQNYIDITRQHHNGLYMFMIFFGICISVMGLWSAIGTWSLYPVAWSVWMFFWVSLWYIPFTIISKRINT